MKTKSIRRVLLFWAILLVSVISKGQPPRGPLARSPQVHPDNTVTFQFIAPGAKDVKLSAQFEKGSVAMTKNASGLWSITVGPVKPDIYPYNFIVDGIQVMDPGNVAFFPNEHFKASLVDIPGDTPLIHSMQDVPHGTITYTSYKSKTMNGMDRPLVVYTPPGYEKTPDKKYPVLYLISGTTDTEETWYKVRRANFILDNLIAQGKAKPMIIVMPYANVMPGPGEGFTKDVLNDIIPFVEANYPVFTDSYNCAIAGFSVGGGQTLNIGLPNTDKFAYVCSYAPYTTTEEFTSIFTNWNPDAALVNKQL